MKYGPGLVTGVTFQWQDGKQVTLWPAEVANGKREVPVLRQAAEGVELSLPRACGSGMMARPGSASGPGRHRDRSIMLALQILIDGFAISALYGLGAVGFTLMFGVSGVLNLAHGGIMVIAALIGWCVGRRPRRSAPGSAALVGVLAALVAAYATYFVVVRPIQRSRAIPREETEIFVLTGTLLWGIMIQVGMAYLFTDNPVTIRPLIDGVVQLAGVRTPANEMLIAAVSWVAIGLLWLLVNRTRAGKRAARRLDQSARADAARLRSRPHLPAGLDDLRRAGRHRRACCWRRSSASAPTMSGS